ncbi:MAG: translation initiation factor IF-2 [Methanobacteriota archaeon]|nr:MAG: translation initiation factor IF-2 [Euryarchaeota archaeon]
MSETTEGRVRAPIGVIMGHVDSGKTSLLDKVRKSAVQAREAKGITQHIGASFFPSETIEQVGYVLHGGKVKLKIPGILMVDTPGHAAFMNLRSRGASVADIAILVVDLTSGFQAQTYESIQTLRRRKVPFIVAANKIDRLSGWKGHKDEPFVKSYQKQIPAAKAALDTKIYEVMGELSQLGFESDRYDRVKDFTKKVAIIPTSAVTGEGVADLFLVLAGLTQQFLMKKLRTTDTPGKAVILEVKEETGLGTTLDVILYDGSIYSDDLIVVGGRNGPIITKMRAMLEPKPLDEMRDPRDKFIQVDEVHASAGVKITGPNLEDAMAGAPLYVAEDKKDAKRLAKMIEEELAEFQIKTDDEGIVLKADTLGSLEALVGMIRERGIPIRKADVGDVSKRDVLDAVITANKKPEYGAILCFNVKITDDAQEYADVEGVQVFKDNVVYNLLDKYIEWLNEMQAIAKKEEEGQIKKPTKFRIMPEFIFRKSKPAVVGVEILAGELEPRDILIDENNKRVGSIVQIKHNNENIKKATKGMQVAVSIKGPTVGRQIHPDQILYVDLRQPTALKLMTKYHDKLTEDEKEVFSELERMKKRAGYKFWPFAN